MNSITPARTFGAFHSVMTQWSGSSQRRAPLALLQAIRATIPPASPHLSFSLDRNTGADVWGVPLGYDAMVWVESAPSATGPIASDPGYDSTGFASFELQFRSEHRRGRLGRSTRL